VGGNEGGKVWNLFATVLRWGSRRGGGGLVWGREIKGKEWKTIENTEREGVGWRGCYSYSGAPTWLLRCRGRVAPRSTVAQRSVSRGAGSVGTIGVGFALS
jgi:hypothetical protein